MKYVAMYGYSFDPEKVAKLFDTFDEGWKWLRDLAESEYKIEKNEDEWDVKMYVYSNEINIVSMNDDGSKDICWYYISEIKE